MQTAWFDQGVRVQSLSKSQFVNRKLQIKIPPRLGTSPHPWPPHNQNRLRLPPVYKRDLRRRLPRTPQDACSPPDSSSSSSRRSPYRACLDRPACSGRDQLPRKRTPPQVHALLLSSHRANARRASPLFHRECIL